MDFGEDLHSKKEKKHKYVVKTENHVSYQKVP